MGSVRRRDVMATVLALALLTGGCGAVPEEPPVALRAGYDSLDGSLRVWPARGNLAEASSEAGTASWRSGERLTLVLGLDGDVGSD